MEKHQLQPIIHEDITPVDIYAEMNAYTDRINDIARMKPGITRLNGEQHVVLHIGRGENVSVALKDDLLAGVLCAANQYLKGAPGKARYDQFVADYSSEESLYNPLFSELRDEPHKEIALLAYLEKRFGVPADGMEATKQVEYIHEFHKLPQSLKARLIGAEATALKAKADTTKHKKVKSFVLVAGSILFSSGVTFGLVHTDGEVSTQALAESITTTTLPIESEVTMPLALSEVNTSTTISETTIATTLPPETLPPETVPPETIPTETITQDTTPAAVEAPAPKQNDNALSVNACTELGGTARIAINGDGMNSFLKAALLARDGYQVTDNQLARYSATSGPDEYKISHILASTPEQPIRECAPSLDAFLSKIG